MLKPPQPLNCVSSAVAVPLGVWPLNDGRLSGSVSFFPVWQPGGLGAAARVPPAPGPQALPAALLPHRCGCLTWRCRHDAEPPQRKDGSDDDRNSRGDEQAVLHEMFLLPAAGARTSTARRAERMLASGMRITPVRTTAVV